MEKKKMPKLLRDFIVSVAALGAVMVIGLGICVQSGYLDLGGILPTKTYELFDIFKACDAEIEFTDNFEDLTVLYVGSRGWDAQRDGTLLKGIKGRICSLSDEMLDLSKMKATIYFETDSGKKGNQMKYVRVAAFTDEGKVTGSETSALFKREGADLYIFTAKEKEYHVSEVVLTFDKGFSKNLFPQTIKIKVG